MNYQNAIAVGCVITCDRLAWARTLAQSIRAYNPEINVFALVVDEIDGRFDAEDEPFEVVELSNLLGNDLASLSFKYTAFELCCAAKPLLLRHLILEKGFSRAIYFDVDIMVLSSLEPLLARLERSDILLTPHIQSDLPPDGKSPDDAHVMKSGVFNAGFIGVRGSVDGLAFLNWWWGKCRDNCVVDHFNGFFVDQKYLDLAIGLFNGIDVVGDPGCNVAYWNLHERRVEFCDGRWLANGHPIVFFHFSDYRFSVPDAISGHQNRFSFQSLPELKPLFSVFRKSVLENGDELCGKWPYGYRAYENGRRIAERTRRAYRLSAPDSRPIEPFNTSTHSLAFKLRSLYQGCVRVIQKVVQRLLARKQIYWASGD